MKLRRVMISVLTPALIILLIMGISELWSFKCIEEENAGLRSIAILIPEKDQGIDPEDPMNRRIDFERLRKINPDITGWIYIPGTGIDYPILSGATDTEYLERDFAGNVSRSGSLFTYAGADLSEDGHVCIFGHNMISGQMFGRLKRYVTENYSSDCRDLYLYTPERTKHGTLHSVFQCDKYDPVFELNKTENQTAVNELAEKLTARNTADFTGKEEFNQIFTLATCSGAAGSDERLTVHFAVTDEKYIL